MSLGPGAILGSYELGELLARGGMGEVYRARHRRLTGREVAIKVMPAILAADPSFLQRFEREANNIAALNHPHILPLWDYGDQQGLPYIVMPLVTGGSLRDRLRGRRLDPAELLRYLRPIADALDYAHAHGIVHRDIKPANVLLDERGHLYVADFGIAKATAPAEPGTPGAAALTRTGVGIGTPEYMAPEQAQGLADPRSDVYALGIIAYEGITGRVPYSGQTPVDVAIKHATVPVPPLDVLGAVANPALDAAIRRALAKSPDDRFASAGDFLRAFAAGVPGAASLDDAERPTVSVAAAGPTAAGAPPTRVLPPATAPHTAQLAAATPPPSSAWRVIAVALALGLLLGLGLTLGAVALLNARGAVGTVGLGASEPSAAVTRTVAGASAAPSALPYAFPISNAVFADKYEEARGRLPEQAKADAKLHEILVECFNPRANADCALAYRLYSRQTDTTYLYSFSIFDTRPVDERVEPAMDDYTRTTFLKLPWEYNPAWPRLLSESYTQLPAGIDQEGFVVELRSEANSLNDASRDWAVKYTDRVSGEYVGFILRGTRVSKEN